MSDTLTAALAKALHDATCIHDDYGVECEQGADRILVDLREQGVLTKAVAEGMWWLAADDPERWWVDQVGWMHGGPTDRSVREVAAALVARILPTEDVT